MEKKMFKHNDDGITHINVYSQAKTPLGRFLSNFHRQEIETEDGKFMSVEGYWYWLSCGDDSLRKLSGFEAKKKGRELKAKDWMDDETFKRKICGAIRNKILSHQFFSSEFRKSTLPLTHYYVYGGKEIFPKEGDWIIDYLESLRTELKNRPS